MTVDYLHGFDSKEQARLLRQAQFTEHDIYHRIDFSDCKRIIEIGSGVGAQTEIILRRFPRIEKVTGIDKNKNQLETSREFLKNIPHAQGRYEIKEMDATSIEFDSHSFDAAFICWVLEHISNPTQVLSEARRMVVPGGQVIITEVMNSTFFLDPYSPNIWKMWMAFNDYQVKIGGDPFIGIKLGNMLLSLGFTDIQTHIITWHYDNRNPHKRKQYIEELREIMFSAAEQLIEADYISKKTAKKAEEEFSRVANDPNAVYYFSFMQAHARV